MLPLEKSNNISTSTLQDSNSPVTKPGINSGSCYKSMKGSINELEVKKVDESQKPTMQTDDIKINIELGSQTMQKKCNICKSEKESQNNLIIDSCNCDENSRYVHSYCLKEKLEKNLLEEVSKMRCNAKEEPRIEKTMRNYYFNCEKCKYEYRIKVKTEHHFGNLKRYYQNATKISCIRDIGIFFYFLVMVLANFGALIAALISFEISTYGCYLCISLMLFLCGFGLSTFNLLEKMEESIWIFGKEERDFFPLKEYLIFLENKNKK